MKNINQWICTVCGYNMIGKMPNVCPFCGAKHDQFVTDYEGEQKFKVTPRKVNEYVTQLLSVPRLGFEHAAYSIKTDDGEIWIDCPSAFNRNISPTSDIYFTHHHFMGACNQYREFWGNKIHMHALDSKHPLAVQFHVDDCFDEGFETHGIQAFHIGGHTPGFTFYIYKTVLFICDYAFPPGSHMRLNPYGPRDETMIGAKKMVNLIAERPIDLVCGYNYVSEFKDWHRGLLRIVTGSD